ncbi:MAG: hypothetical protein OES38_20850 [Gammaproteobacteria bacterium]|nr:hypothetical protein [Gammaproteobacteria bacterium]
MIRYALPCGAILLALTGCVTNTVQEIRESATGMDATDSIVVLGRRGRPQTAETELDFVSCVAKNVGKGAGKLNVIEEEAFVDAMFPWFEPRTAPVNTSDLPELMALPALTGRLNELGLRYLVWVQGSTKRTESAGSLTCSVTTAGAGCFGFLTWEKDSSYEASVWDVKNGTTAGKVSSDAIGTSYMPALVVPLPFIAPVRSSACSSLADRLKTFLTDET